MPANKILKIPTVPRSAESRTVIAQLNKLINDVAALNLARVQDDFAGFYGIGANSGAAPMLRGSTDTNVGLSAMTFAIAGVPVIKASSAAGTAFGALGTIPASTWGVIALDVVTAGTITFVSGALNYTTGYTTEALAQAAGRALPRTTLKARVGFVTILASASTFVVGTDALAGGSSGNPATTTNYYWLGSAEPTGTNMNSNGVVFCGNQLSGTAWTGGVNGVVMPTTLAIGSTDTRVSSTPFIYNCNGLSNVPKAVDAAGTAFGALGTIPADQWGAIGLLIDAAGTKTFVSGSANYTTGYPSEALAQAAMNQVYPSTSLCYYGFITIKTGAGLAWIAGTDALAGGTTGNEALYTNYYPIAGVTISTGISAAQIADPNGTVIT